MMEEEIRRLITLKSETANLDYKEGFLWTKNNRDKKYELIRDLLGMANTRDGGRIIFGVRDEDYEFIGVTNEVFQSVDPSDVIGMLHDYGDPKVICEVYKLMVDSKKVILFDVREFEDTPIICTEAIKSTDLPRVILRKGAIYIRTSAATTEEIPSSNEMRELLGRAVQRKGDEFLRSFEKLISGKSAKPEPDSLNLYQTEILQTDQFFRDRLGKGFLQSPRWELIVHLSQYTATRAGDLPSIQNLIRSSEVRLRGWNFPHSDKENASNFNLGRQSFTDWQDIREGYRFYKSGLFVFKRALWEDLRGDKTKDGRRPLSFINTIYTLTELALFMKRLYENLAIVGNVHVAINLTGCNDRELATYDGMVHLPPWYVGREDSIKILEEVRPIDLRVNWDGIAREWSIKIFHVFNWNDVTDETIQHWQTKLIERQF